MLEAFVHRAAKDGAGSHEKNSGDSCNANIPKTGNNSHTPRAGSKEHRPRRMTPTIQSKAATAVMIPVTPKANGCRPPQRRGATTSKAAKVKRLKVSIRRPAVFTLRERPE